MRILFLLGFLLLLNTGFAQQDYLVLHSGDTIKGTFISLSSNNIRYRIGKERKVIPTQQVKEYLRKKKKFLILQSPFRESLVNCRVQVDGEVLLLRDIRSNFSNVYAVDFVMIEGVLYPLDEAYLSDAVWSRLARCKSFEEKYRKYKKKVFILNVPRSRKRWKEMITFYNTHCQND